MTYRNHGILSFLVMLLAIGTVTLLAWETISTEKQKSKFNRSHLENRMELAKVMQNTDILGFAGHTDSLIYFKTKEFGKVQVTNWQLQNPRYLIFSFPKTKKVVSFNYLFVDSPNAKLFACNVPAIITTQIGQQPKLIRFTSNLFTRVVPITTTTFVFRGFDTAVRATDQIFFKYNAIANNYTREINISAINNDAGISTDGDLLFDKKTNRVLFIPYYQSEFICMDTNLTLLYRQNTIDLIQNNQSKSKQTSSNGYITNLSPFRVIHNTNYAHNGHLFINSTIKANNETDDKFQNNSVIDVYNIISGKYEGSFPIPNYKSERMALFVVSDNLLLAIYKSSIIRYNFSIRNPDSFNSQAFLRKPAFAAAEANVKSATF